MKDRNRLKEKHRRRSFIKTIGSTGLVLGLRLKPLAGHSKEILDGSGYTPEVIATYPLAQDHSVIYAVDDPKTHATSCSSLVRLSSGRLFATISPGYQWRHPHKKRLEESRGTFLMASDDNGMSWHKIGEGLYPLLLVRDKLYQFIVRQCRDLAKQLIPQMPD